MSKNSSSNNTSRIGQDFTLIQLLKFALPAMLTSICSQLFSSLDDGLFVSRYAGETALAAINLLMPVNCIIMGCSQLCSIGATTISAQKMGEGDHLEAKRVFTRIVLVAGMIGGVIAAIMNIFARPICHFLGAVDDQLMEYALTYVRIVLSATPIHLMSIAFTSYFSTAGRPDMSLLCSILNGASNIVLDILLVATLDLKVVGSSTSTAIGDTLVLIVGLIFYSNSKHDISFARPHGNFVSTAIASASSGFSQFINSISLSLTSFVTNRTLLSILGSNGIAANSIIGQLRSILTAGFIGYVGCVGPIIAYNYGSKNAPRLKKILTHNLKVWFFGTIMFTIVGQLLRNTLISIFIKEGSSEIYAMAYEGLTIEFFAVMFTAGCVFVMRMFVALGAPKTAAVLTTLRNFVIRLAMLLILPRLFNEVGVWLAFPVAEFLSFIVAAILVIVNADNYGYGKSGVAWFMQPAGSEFITDSEVE